MSLRLVRGRIRRGRTERNETQNIGARLELQSVGRRGRKIEAAQTLSNSN